MSRFLAAVLLALPVLLASPASAQEARPPASAPYEHDGLLLQFQAGPAYLFAFDDRGSARGMGLGLHGAVGFSPFRNGILMAELLTQSADGLTVKSELGERTIDDRSMSITHIGPAFGYYFGDSNFFAVGGVGITRMTMSEDWMSVDLAGFGGRVGLGKEWWIADQWGLGVAANFLIGSVTLEEELDAEPLTVGSLGLTMTATYQ